MPDRATPAGDSGASTWRATTAAARPHEQTQAQEQGERRSRIVGATGHAATTTAVFHSRGRAAIPHRSAAVAWCRPRVVRGPGVHSRRAAVGRARVARAGVCFDCAAVRRSASVFRTAVRRAAVSSPSVRAARIWGSRIHRYARVAAHVEERAVVVAPIAGSVATARRCARTARRDSADRSAWAAVRHRREARRHPRLDPRKKATRRTRATAAVFLRAADRRNGSRRPRTQPRYRRGVEPPPGSDPRRCRGSRRPSRRPSEGPTCRDTEGRSCW